MTAQEKVNAKMEYVFVWKDFMVNLAKEDHVKTHATLEEYVLMENVNVTKDLWESTVQNKYVLITVQETENALKINVYAIMDFSGSIVHLKHV